MLEDNEFQRKALLMGLTAMGVGYIAEATDGREALDLLAQNKIGFDFTICDLRMDVMDGIEFLRFAPAQRIGSVILTSAMKEDLLRSAEAVAKDYGVRIAGRITKPIDFSFLRKIMSSDEAMPEVQAMVEEESRLRLWTKNDLIAALALEQFVPFFQPKVQFTKVPFGVEILARWRHPDLGDISPSEFVPLMELHGLIDQLTEQLLRKALDSMKIWREVEPQMGIALNASRSTLQNVAIPNRWRAIANEHLVEPESITIEVTETALATDYEGLLETVTRLRMHGFNLSLDDFGTGYSSLQQLSRMPFSEIKIDRSFVTGAEGTTRSMAILNSIFDLAKNLNLSTVAEGIESESDAAFIQSLGCDAGQGYYFAKPMAGDDLLRWLGRSKPHPLDS
ncbi:EAL domain-containing protein [Glaciimonas sp. PAMC28666]|uniref:EAL domain-containing response regulator n=1 Tax=Glaciimonas sp. PAMC28666 TaxID=2807626 RepID=UPI00196607EF|nr:EAL domain-containing response regulator [Glaciimonas sp. PAMC28666]QRX82849.1 EAL domain-containing response regulator [Glaciimonas sp. PAMC28666]